MPIVISSNTIPERFNNSDFKQLSEDGKDRYRKLFNLAKQSKLPSFETVLDMIFETSLECCKQHFNINKDASFSHSYRRNGLDISTSKSSVFINDTLIYSLYHYTLVVFYHCLYFDDPDVSFDSYKELLFITNEQCNNTYALPQEDSIIGVMEKYPSVRNLNVAADVYWGMITFLLLHELSHIFLNHLTINKNQTIAETEYDADKEAYLIFLNMIHNKEKYRHMEFLENYIYLAPIMTIDFFTLVNFVDGTINGNKYVSYHPPHEKRKDSLFNIFDTWDCEFDSREGNAIYYWYERVVVKFKNSLYNANEQGLLESIKRNKVTKMNVENIVSFISEITDEMIAVDALSGEIARESIDGLINDHICFIADEEKSDFVLMNLKSEKAKSFKLSNIIVNFKKLLDSLLEIALTSSLPSSRIQAIKYALYLVYKVFNMSTRELSDDAAQVLLFLHQHGAYNKYINEEDVINYFRQNNSIEKEAVSSAIDSLLKLRCIDMAQGKITVLERLYLR